MKIFFSPPTSRTVRDPLNIQIVDEGTHTGLEYRAGRFVIIGGMRSIPVEMVLKAAELYSQAKFSGHV